MDWGYILCIDDDLQELSTLANQLQEEFSRSHIVYKAVSVEEAALIMDMLQAGQKPIELILCKQRMPGIQGSAFLDDVQKSNPDIMKLLLVDADDMLPSEYILSRATIHNYLERPWKREHLLLTVESLLKLHKISQSIEHLQEVGLQFDPIFDLPELLHRTSGYLESITTASKVAIAITNGRDWDIQMVVSNADKNQGDNELRNSPVPEGIQHLINEVFASRREPLVFNYVADNRYLQRFDIPDWYKARHLVCIPLWRKEFFFGVLFMADKPSGLSFFREDILFAKIIAFQLLASLENIRLTEEKLRIERVSTIGNMASEIIHDLKGPMTTIMGFAELLERDDCTPQEQQEYSSMISSEVEDMVAMVEEILEFSRGSKMTLNLAACRTQDLVNEVSEALRRTFQGQNIQLITKLNCRRVLYADKEKLKRVFYNVARNAAEAMRDHGRFSINTYLHNPTHVEFRLADSGPGIRQDVKDHIFEPFVTYGKKRGTGLGMSIAKKIITDHGGGIWVESEEGKGTIFYFTVPIFQEK